MFVNLLNDACLLLLIQPATIYSLLNAVKSLTARNFTDAFFRK